MSLVGKYAGRFRIVAEIGRGGMGVVYRARDTRLGREVAVKVLDQRYINEESVRRDFIREARTAGGLQKHANIVAIFDYGTIEGLPYFVMDFVEGRPLDQLLLQGRPFGLVRATRIVHQLASALDHAHRHGLVHCDVKPHNVILDRDDHVTLTDFGIARSFRDTHMTYVGQGGMVGTPAYMSPEQFESDPRKLKPATDIYSLGVLAYRLFTGQMPFKEGNIFQLQYEHSKVMPAPPSSVNRSLPTMMDPVLLKALAKRPRDRYRSAGEFGNELTTATALSISMTGQSPPAPTPGWFIYLLASLAGLVAVGGLIALIFLLRASPEPSEASTASPVSSESPPVEETSGDSGEFADLSMPTSDTATQVSGAPPIDTAPPPPSAVPERAGDANATASGPPVDVSVAQSIDLIEPAEGAPFGSGVVRFGWRASPAVPAQVAVCFGANCKPEYGIHGYTTDSRIDWDPCMSLANRADLEGRTGVYRWRVVSEDRRRSSETRSLSWGGCGASSP